MEWKLSWFDFKLLISIFFIPFFFLDSNPKIKELSELKTKGNSGPRVKISEANSGRNQVIIDKKKKKKVGKKVVLEVQKGVFFSSPI